MTPSLVTRRHPSSHGRNLPLTSDDNPLLRLAGALRELIMVERFCGIDSAVDRRQRGLGRRDDGLAIQPTVRYVCLDVPFAVGLAVPFDPLEKRHPDLMVGR